MPLGTNNNLFTDIQNDLIKPLSLLHDTDGEESTSLSDISLFDEIFNKREVSSTGKGLQDSSTRKLLQIIERQSTTIHSLKNENTDLREREVKISALTVGLQKQFASLQQQVDHIKTNIKVYLVDPITDEEYNTLISMNEAKRDLMDTIKIGIYQQIGSFRNGKDAAIRRSNELALEVSKLENENTGIKQRLAEVIMLSENEKDAFQKKAKETEKNRSLVLELSGTVSDLKSKLKESYINQENYLTTKVRLTSKIEECARIGLQLNERDGDVEKYKTMFECAEQKLEILMSEFYELKLSNGQHIVELENKLKIAQQRLESFQEMEQEAELFINNVSQQQLREAEISSHLNPLPISYLSIPESRKFQHILNVTKRCLSVENKVVSLQHELVQKQEQIGRLQNSLDMARQALRQEGSPFALIEETVDHLMKENETLKNEIKILQVDNKYLREIEGKYLIDKKLLEHHKEELLRIKALIETLDPSLSLSKKSTDPCLSHPIYDNDPIIIPGNVEKNSGKSQGMLNDCKDSKVSPTILFNGNSEGEKKNQFIETTAHNNHLAVAQTSDILNRTGGKERIFSPGILTID